MHSSPAKGQSFSNTPPAPDDYLFCKDFPFLQVALPALLQQQGSNLSGFTIKRLMATVHRRINLIKSQAKEKASFTGI